MFMLIPVLIGISIITFVMVRLIPGDPARIMAGERATEEQVQRVRQMWGLDKPIHEQYIIYMKNLLHGNLGRSLKRNETVVQELRWALPTTIELSFAAMFFAVLIGIPAGILAAYRQNSWWDLAVMVGSMVGISMPVFWLGLLLIYVFALKLGVMPPSGRLSVGVKITPITGMYTVDALLTGNWRGFLDAVHHLIMPAVAVGTIPMAIIARMTRSSLLEVLRQDYIRTARAKGLNERTVIFRHALKNAFLPVVTIIGLQLGTLLVGAILTESIFALPGMGRLIVDRILSRDYPVVQGAVLVFATTFVFINLLVDISYAYLDPRIRYQ
ncbi:MAG: ABC transporter permease [Chloroflexi bacterium]|nr:ABC transporter permease [Chloroflexota bacterium]